jgi:hypothetical protein
MASGQGETVQQNIDDLCNPVFDTLDIGSVIVYLARPGYSGFLFIQFLRFGMVDREKFGERHSCFECGCKFYDMKKNPPVCPRCGIDVSRRPEVPVTIVIPPDDDIIDDDDEPSSTLEDEELPLEDLDGGEEMSEEEIGED